MAAILEKDCVKVKGNQLKAGALISYLNLLVGNIIPFIYTPIMLRLLGQAEYGLYGIAQSVMGYIGLLNFGIGGTIVRYMSKYRAEGDVEKERRTVGLFLKIYTVIGCLILCAGLFCAANLDGYGRSLTGDELAILRSLVVLMTVNMAVFMPFNVFSSVIMAYERFVFSKLMGLLAGVAAPVLNLVLLYLGFGSVGLVVSSTAINLLTYTAYTWYVLSGIRLRPSFSRSEPGLLREILGYSGFIFLASLVDIMYWATDKLIIGWAIGAAAAAVYNIGATFNTYVTALSSAVSGLLIPKLTQMAVKDAPREEFTQIFIKVGRLQFILVSFIVSAFVAFGRQFILLWAGADYGQAYYVALLTMIPVTVPLIQNTGINILYALNRHRFRSVVYACIAVVNVVLTFRWVACWGIVGAALATCLSYVVGNILIINWYYYKKIGIDIPLFWKNIVKMSPVMVAMGASAWLILDRLAVDSWGKFFGYAVIYSAVYGVLAYRFMMNRYEREIVLIPVKKVLKKTGLMG